MSSELSEKILFLIDEKKPRSVKELSELVRHTCSLTENEILIEILKMRSNGLIKLNKSEIEPFSFREYLASRETIWYWIIIAVGSVVALLFFINSETIYPLIYARNVFGLLFVLFFPGYALMRILLPINLNVKAPNDQIHSIQRIALSIATSIVIVTLIGMLVYYSPWGLNLSIIVLSLLVITQIMTTSALVREYQVKRFHYNDQRAIL